jgi:hypothetical protein
MCAAKSKSRSLSLPATLKRLISYLTGRGRSTAIAVLLGAGFIGGWYMVWREVRGHVLSSRAYRVGPQELEITPLPEWIHSDIRGEVLRSATLDGPLSIMDDNLAERIAGAFSLHPWIAKVRRVTKHHPARVTVEVEYRRPVLMVEVPGGLLPVDVQGVLLPKGDFSPVEQSRFPRLARIDTAPLGTAGEFWGDPRVVGAAEIAAALGQTWLELKLTQIVPSASPVSGIPEDYVYTLLTRSGTRIVWGRAPGRNVPGELPPAEKIARLKQYVVTHGTLEGRGGPQELDLRVLRVSQK